MNDFDNLVHKNNNFVLQTLSCLCKLPDSAETKNEFDSLPLRVEIQTRVNLY